MPIAEIVDDQPADEYHRSDAVSRSTLAHFIESPRTYQSFHVSKASSPDFTSDKLDLGTSTHAWLLQPDMFSQLVKKIPRDALNADGHKKGKAWTDFKKANDGVILLLDKETKWVYGMRDAILAHPIAGRMIRDAKAVEQSVYWWDQEYGMNRRCRLDLVTGFRQYPFIADVKTAVDHRPIGFGNACRRYGYGNQEPYYLDGWSAAIGSDEYYFAFIVVNSKPPHQVRVYVLDERSRRVSRTKIDVALGALAECYASDNWAEDGEEFITEISLGL